jgi:phospholipid-binding lipoprotein MlaA
MKRVAMIFFIRVFLIFAVLAFSPAHQSFAGTGEENNFPDLLADEFLDDDEFDEFGEREEFEISDPLEVMNRVFFEFNDKLYDWILKPVSDGYSWVLPEDLRVCIGNFFRNMNSPIRLLNTLLQGDIEGAGRVLGRFLINSTLGVYGFGDVAAQEFEMAFKKADFGQTLGKWGVGEGVYFCWPVFGPSSSRDTVGFIVDIYSHPVPYFHENRYLDLAYYSTTRVNKLSLQPNLYEDLRRFSFDPYIASREAFYEYRRALIGRK